MRCRACSAVVLSLDGDSGAMPRSRDDAAASRRAGFERASSLTTGIAVAGGAGALAIAVGLAVSGAAAHGAGSSGTAGTGSGAASNGTGQSTIGDDGQQQAPAGGLAPAGNSAPQAQTHGS
jgi:hypothetical protein